MHTIEMWLISETRVFTLSMQILVDEVDKIVGFIIILDEAYFSAQTIC